MNLKIRKILELYLNNKNSNDSINNEIKELFTKDDIIFLAKKTLFITILLEWDILASFWKIHITEKNIFEEILKILTFLKVEERSKILFESPEILDKCKIRIDILDKNSKVPINSEDEINKLDINKTWLLLIRPENNDLSIILPWINALITNWKELYFLLCEKVWLEYIYKNTDYLYKIKTEIFYE